MTTPVDASPGAAASVSTGCPDLPVSGALAMRLTRLDAFVLRSPVQVPIRTSFGTMHDRPAVFVRAEDADGSVGWGEIWCNFPACGAEHRAQLLRTLVAPLLLGRDVEGPAQAFAQCSARTEVLAIQCGEPGPMAQVIAGVDLALWDLCARRAGLPLHRLLGGERSTVPVYASGINPDRPQDMVQQKRGEGFTAFKLKIGFDAARDLANIEAVHRELCAGESLMLDVNQAWGLRDALEHVRKLEAFGLAWLEEPLRADRPQAEWLRLRQTTRIPLAAGENLMGDNAFDQAIESGALSVIQPDLAKWGGISGCWPVIQRIQQAGLRYCPHYLGAGIGLLASAHVLAAAGGDGWLEVDANPNPLRTALAPQVALPRSGVVDLGSGPGVGVVPDMDRLHELCRPARA